MQPGHDVYKRAIEKVKYAYKTWKHQTLHDALKWVNKLLKGDHSGLHLRKEYNYLRLRQKINSIFDYAWLPELFKFADEAIDLSNCSEKGLLFLRCTLSTSCRLRQANTGHLDAFVITIVHARFTYLHKRFPQDPRFSKYDRKHQLATFSGLNGVKEFMDLDVRDFPLRKDKKRRSSPGNPVDLNVDSDNELGPDFYTAPTPESLHLEDDSAREMLDDGLDGGMSNDEVNLDDYNEENEEI
jgi:hypothetical protein